MGVTGECDPGHDSCQFGPYGADESMCRHCTGSSCPRRRNVKHGYSADCCVEAQQLPPHHTSRARLASPFREGQCHPDRPVV